MLAAVTKTADAAVTAKGLTKEQRDALVAKTPAWLDRKIAETHTGRHGDPGAMPVAPQGGMGAGMGANDGSAPVDPSLQDAFQTA